MSGFGKLDLRDMINGLVMAVGSAVLTFMQQLIQPGGSISAINWRLVGGVAAGAAVTYLLKNVFTTAEGKTLGISATAPKPKDEYAMIAAQMKEPEIIHTISEMPQKHVSAEEAMKEIDEYAESLKKKP